MWAQEVLALSRRRLLIALRERLNLLFSVPQPAVWLVFFAERVLWTGNGRIATTTGR